MSDAEPTEPFTVADVLHSITDLAAPLEQSAVLEQIGRVAAESINADIGFMGVLADNDMMKIAGVHGGTTGAIESLQVERGRGLGGKVLALEQPSSVVDYTTADSITHEYDKEIGQEGLRAMMSVPIVIDNALLGVAYVSDRVPKAYSDTMVDRVLTAVDSAKIALSMADRARQLTEAAVEVERQRTVNVLDSSVRAHLDAILATAKSIAAAPESSAELVAQADSIISTAGDVSSLFDSSAAGLLSTAARDTAPLVVPDFGLSSREHQVVQLAARGLSNPEIAEELFLARGTVKAYMEASLRKLGARNRVEAVMIAAEAGLLENF